MAHTTKLYAFLIFGALALSGAVRLQKRNKRAKVAQRAEAKMPIHADVLGEYYNLDVMPVIKPNPDDYHRVSMIFPGVSTPRVTAPGGEPLSACEFPAGNNMPECDVPELDDTGGGIHKVEGFGDFALEDVGLERPATPTQFWHLDRYCLIHGASVSEYEGIRAIDHEGIRELVVHQLEANQKDPKAYSNEDLESFAINTAFLAEVHLRLPEMLSVDPSGFPDVPPEVANGRWLTREKQGSRAPGGLMTPDGAREALTYGVDYTCDPDASIARSKILQDIGCKRMRFYRVPNYLRALVVACEVFYEHSGETHIVPLCESKGAGLPRYAPHTKTPNDSGSMNADFLFKRGVSTGQGGFAEHMRNKETYNETYHRTNVHFLLERGIDRWKISDHGSGAVSVTEAVWEFGLGKYLDHIIDDPRFAVVRTQTCEFMNQYLKDLYGEGPYIGRLGHPSYNNIFPQKLIDNCVEPIRTVPHLAVVGLNGWQAKKPQLGDLNHAILIRGLSRRNFLSYWSEPDIFGHPGANHHTAGIVAAFYAVSSVYSQGHSLDFSENKILKATATGRAAQALLKSVHWSGGKFLHMNFQADAERIRLFDFGHFWIKKPGGSSGQAGDANSTLTTMLMSYWHSNWKEGDEMVSLSSEVVPGVDTTYRMVDAWWYCIGDPDRDYAVSHPWLYNQVLYMDAMLAHAIGNVLFQTDKKTSELDKKVASIIFKKEYPTAAYPVDALSATPSKYDFRCKLIGKLMGQLHWRARHWTDPIRWVGEMYDAVLGNTRWVKYFIATMKKTVLLGYDAAGALLDLCAWA